MCEIVPLFMFNVKKRLRRRQTQLFSLAQTKLTKSNRHTDQQESVNTLQRENDVGDSARLPDCNENLTLQDLYHY